MIKFLQILQTRDISLFNPKAKQKDLEQHWKMLYDEFWKQKNDSFAKLMLRKENELLIKETKLSILYTIHNTILCLGQLKSTEKTIEQKQKLISLYEKQTKNKLNIFISLSEFLQKVKDSISNFENQIDKLKKEVRSKSTQEVANSFDVVAGVIAILQIPLDIKTLSVAEFLSYEKIAKAKQESYGKK